jgi:hypothetical protein
MDYVLWPFNKVVYPVVVVALAADHYYWTALWFAIWFTLLYACMKLLAKNCKQFVATLTEENVKEYTEAIEANKERNNGDFRLSDDGPPRSRRRVPEDSWSNN